MYTFIIIIYVLFLLFFSFTSYSKNKNEYIVSIFFVVLFFLLAGYRPDYVSDTLPYKEYYIYFQEYKIDNFNIVELLDYEIGYYYLMFFCHKIYGNNYICFFITISMINFSLFYFGTKLIVKNLYLSNSHNENLRKSIFLFMPIFTLYITYYGFMYNLIVLRAGITLSLLYFAISLVINKKRLISLLFLSLSLLFHRSSIIGLIIYILFLYLPTFSRKSYLLFICVVLLLYICNVSQFINSANINAFFILSDNKSESLFGSYLAREQMDIGRYSLRTLAKIINILFILLLNKNIGNNYFPKILNCLLIGTFFQVVFDSISTFSRIVDYFLFFSFLFYYYGIHNIYNKFYKYLLFSWIIISNTVIFLIYASLI